MEREKPYNENFRPDWDTFWLGMCKYVSKRGSCPTKKVGAVIVEPETNVMLSMGYNGSPRKTEHCGEPCAKRKMGERQQNCKAVHAEINAILNAAFSGIKLRGARIYVTVSPCLTCARAIIQAGIGEVICAGKSPYAEALKLLESAGVKFRMRSGVSLPKVYFKVQ